MASTNQNRILLWDQEEDELARVERVLKIVNPKGCTADYIKRHVDNELYLRGLDSYVGTGGWYVTVYKTSETDGAGQEIWRPRATLMAYSVERWLKEKGLMQEEPA